MNKEPKKDDCISRRAAIDIVREECRKYTTMCIMTMNRLEKLPSMHSNPIVGEVARPERRYGNLLHVRQENRPL